MEASLTDLKARWKSQQDALIQSLQLRLGQTQERLTRLTDAYLDQAIDREVFEQRKTALQEERCTVEEQLAQLRTNGHAIPHQLSQFLELAGRAYLLYEMALPEEKRDLLEIATSNRMVEGKSVKIMLSSPFQALADELKMSDGSPRRITPRTSQALFDRLAELAKESPLPTLGNVHIPSTEERPAAA